MTRPESPGEGRSASGEEVRRRSLIGSRPARFGVAALLVTVVVALGPRHGFEERWLQIDLVPDFARAIAVAEARVPDLRPGDQAEVVWAGDEGRRTETSIVYLHGFSADRHEIEPVVSNVAHALGANVYFPRLAGHGRDGTAMAEATVERWLDDTVRAIAVGRAIGERVVLIGTSTGGTLAAWAANRPEADDLLAAVVLVSPNLHPKDRGSRVLLYPWGGLLSRLVVGPERCWEPDNEQHGRHWTTCYPTEALLPMMALTEHVRTSDLRGIDAPTLVLYDPGDRVVEPEETVRALGSLPGDHVRVLRYERSSDPARHVLGGDIVSPASTGEVSDLLIGYLRDVLPGRAEADPGEDGGVAP